jgi:plastocyanin
MAVRHASRVKAAVFAAALTAVLVAGCSNREAEVNKRPHAGTALATEVDGFQQVVIRSGVDLRFSPSTIVVHPGRVRIVLVNTAHAGAGPPHDLQFSGLPGDDVPLVAAGHALAVTFMAPAPGTYRFICSIHLRQGQTGKMIVR